MSAGAISHCKFCNPSGGLDESHSISSTTKRQAACMSCCFSALHSLAISVQLLTEDPCFCVTMWLTRHYMYGLN